MDSVQIHNTAGPPSRTTNSEASYQHDLTKAHLGGEFKYFWLTFHQIDLHFPANLLLQAYHLCPLTWSSFVDVIQMSIVIIRYEKNILD